MDSQIFKSCCHEFEQFPENLPRSDLSSKKLDAYVRQLDDREDVLFSFSEDASLDFWDLHDDQKDFKPVRATSLGDMIPLCCVGTSTDGQNIVKHPICRFLFVYSKNSRSRLYTTREMLTLALSYHQVLPWFLDFLFPFGQQTEQHDFRFSSLRHKSYVDYQPTLTIKHLNRSGQDIHMCYNLKAVEPTSTNKLMPWSVRQTVIYHSFDTVNGQSFWIVLKGNNSLSEDLRPETNRMRWQGDNEEKTKELSFAACLQTHLSVCNWACENWRPYINHLQVKMDQLTNQSIRTEVIAAPLPMPTLDTDDLLSTQPNRRGAQILRRLTTWRANISKDTYNNYKTRTNTTLSDFDMLEKAPHVQTTAVEVVQHAPYPEIKMSDLQKAQKIEEDTTDALFYLRSNVKIVKALRERYRDFPSMTQTMQKAVSRFDSQLQDVIYELEMHESSLETLLKLFVERKNLLFGILEFQNMQASKILAHKAQNSADRMEKMTENMQELTEKTTKETVSMSVIAGVTMFFLPGTFVSTLMSTDVLQWEQRSDGSYQLLTAPGAVHIFLELTLPLMLVAFVIWGIVSWWNDKQRKAKIKKKQIAEAANSAKRAATGTTTW